MCMCLCACVGVCERGGVEVCGGVCVFVYMCVCARVGGCMHECVFGPVQLIDRKDKVSLVTRMISSSQDC